MYAKVFFVWSVKDRATLEGLDENMSDPVLPLSFSPPMNPIPSNAVAEYTDGNAFYDVPLHSKISMDAKSSVNDNKITSPLSRLGESSGVSYNTNSLMSRDIFHCEYYLSTMRQDKSEQVKMGIRVDDEQQRVYLKLGRPNIAGIFGRITELCRAENIHEVAVMVCGPPPLVNEVVDTCRASRLSIKCDQVRFYVHHEVFDF